MQNVLASIERIERIEPIPQRDRIELAFVRGCSVVVPKDGYREGDLVVFFAPDSMLPTDDLRYHLVDKYAKRTVDPETQMEFYVLGVTKMAGVYSQGLVLPLSDFPELQTQAIGVDVSEILGIKKYQKPEPVKLAGLQRGNFPFWLPKTDELHVYNVRELLERDDGDLWYATEKIDGTSMTVYIDEDDYEGVCSRNWDLKETDENIYWRVARRMDLHGLLRRVFPNKRRIALQGELFGESIQKNPLRIRGQTFRVFSVWADGDYVLRKDWHDRILEIAVPIYSDLTYPKTIREAHGQVEGLKSLVSPFAEAEGVVWRHAFQNYDYVHGDRIRLSFKVINRRQELQNG